ncbi:MAG: hypothetical protein IPJ32_08820 [Sphingobacteriaceae bacterium]|nr:hypothetical protein [Sphingobacteriaceae bacterium]
MNFLFFVWTTESIGEVLFMLKQGSKFSITALYFLGIYWLMFCIGIVIKKAITTSIDKQNKIISIFKFGFPIVLLSLYFCIILKEIISYKWYLQRIT